jgi:hypothetical protein
MKNVVPLQFSVVPYTEPPPVLNDIVVINVPLFNSCVSVSRAAAPKLVIYTGERICTIV